MIPTASPSPAHVSHKTQDKQLSAITLEGVLQKRQLEQALNAKEFAVLAGISYTTARDWFRIPDFPVFRGVVFWQDFADWRTRQNRSRCESVMQKKSAGSEAAAKILSSGLPPRAARLLMEA